MARTRTTSATELLVTLRRDDPAPLHAQLEQELRGAIRSGRLTASSTLPSSRALASQLGLSRGVVVEAYEQLVAEGYLKSHAGGATAVADCPVEAPRAPAKRRVVPSVRVDFGYGRPDLTQFPRQVWMRSIKRVLNEAPSDRFGTLDHRGAAELREALAGYLNRVRGTAADPEHIVITNGFAQAIRLVSLAVKARGGRRVAIEDPGQHDFRRAAAFAGLEAVPVAVDEDGICLDELDRADVDAVYVTSAHHFPTGAVLSAARRAQLVEWARRSNGLILEDDYDAEFRYDREPIGAVQGLSPQHVIYAGSASKTLAPGLRLGWLATPPELVADLSESKEQWDRGSPSLEQLAFADFLEHGEFDRHLRRMRPLYRARRDALLRALQRHLPELRPIGASAGLHVLAWLPPGIDDEALVKRAGAAGVRVEGVRQYFADQVTSPNGLLFGYGEPTGTQIEEGVRIVAAALADVRGPGGRASA
jgi:GntR family transcriptional regulator / MocR family aminotransferase